MCSLPADRHRRAGLLGRGRRVCPAPPDPEPAVFGYHEVLHLLVIAGVAAPFLAISLFALPTG
jgi:predicted membrane channel-forming protein YqfA (hemolysin III family)